MTMTDSADNSVIIISATIVYKALNWYFKSRTLLLDITSRADVLVFLVSIGLHFSKNQINLRYYRVSPC